MRKIKNEDLAQLLMQAKFAPPAKRQKQVDGAEQLLSIIEKNKEYPFEFVCFRITGFRPKDDAGRRLIKGDELAEDLRIFIWKLSGQVAAPAENQSEEVYTKYSLARKLNVSLKTIDRWRKRGLSGRKYVFDAGKKRLGFLLSELDKFLAQNKRLADKVGKYKRLSAEQRRKVIELAQELSSRTTMNRRKVIDAIASQMGRGCETIRNILLNYEKSHPEAAGSMCKVGRMLGSAEAAELARLHKQGVSIKELMIRFGKSRSSVYRILKQRRAQALLANKIDYIQSDEFAAPDAEEKILGGLPEYLKGLKDVAALNRQQELELFRIYNFLKYRAHSVRGNIKTDNVPSSRLDEIERYLAEAETVKNIIIEANLRLVVSIAGRHTITGANLADLVSQGNVALMHAVEKFDYTRGFRFSTYASWLISKDFAHRIPGQKLRPDRSAPSLDEFEKEFKPQVMDAAAVERARHDLIQTIKNNLDSREQFIIINHFGLEGTLVKKNKKTLQQIGVDLGLSKERIRQIELVGLQKLRQALSPEQFELLMG